MDDNKFEKIQFVCGENKIKFQTLIVCMTIVTTIHYSHTKKIK